MIKFSSIILTLIIIITFPTKSHCASFKLEDVVIEGNRIYSKDTILKILEIQPGKTYDSKLLKKRIKKLVEQYESEGYILMRVEKVSFDLDSRLVISIKEGIIDDMFIRGTGIRALMRLRQQISIYTGQTFNSIELKRNLNKIKKKYGYRDLNVDIVPIPGKPGYYNLFIYVSHFSAKKGLYWNITSGGYYGIKTYVGWKQRDFFGQSSEYKIQAAVSIWHDGIRMQEYTFNYLLPVSRVFGPYFNALYGVYKDGRYDLRISFDRQESILEGGFAFKIKKNIILTVGYQMKFPIYFKKEQDDLTAPPMEITYPELFEYDKRLDIAILRFTITDRPFIPRADLASNIKFKLKFYGHRKQNTILTLDLIGKKVFEFGYNQLILEMRSFYIFGKQALYEEISLTGRFLRGYASGSLYTDRAIQISAEYRFSLYKGYIQLCWFVQSSWFNQLHWIWHKIVNKNLVSLGPGIYIQYREFIGYIYYGVGFRERVDKGEYHFAIMYVF